jgi:hypothetical protein
MDLPVRFGCFNYGIDNAIIGFCGEWHLYIKMNKSCSYGPSKSVVAYTYSEMLDFAISEKNDKLYDEISSNKSYDCYGDMTYKTMFENVKNLKKDVFVEYLCPIIVISRVVNEPRHSIVFNGLLRNFDFMKVKDPFQAYQDLSMYVGGVLGSPEKETVKISDECMRDKKGFDKWSFRKQGVK